jgi:hypothetical protein
MRDKSSVVELSYQETLSENFGEELPLLIPVTKHRLVIADMADVVLCAAVVK